MRTIATGLVLGESPRWHDGRLYVSDWGAGEILAFDAGSGGREVVARVERLPFCFDFLPDGRMVIVDGRAGRLVCLEPDGTLAPWVDLTALAPPPWNDIVVDGRGNA